MDENLVGYLLNALDLETHAEVERYIEERPEVRKQLELLRQALQPLEVDRDAFEPPAYLSVRTLARVAELRCQTPAIPAPVVASVPRQQQAEPPAVLKMPPAPRMARATWWRRADVLVAASVLLCVALLIPPGLGYLHYRQDIAACQNNLRTIYTALRGYSEHHAGDFPNVSAVAATPRDVAGLVVPVLHDKGLLTKDFSVRCPANGYQAYSPPPLSRLQEMAPHEFERYARELAGCYAYSLGYRDDSQHRGPRYDPHDPHHSNLPLMADRPPAGVETGDPRNSPNHGGRGQNVLYHDGHCDFRTSRHVGVNGDDIYLNENKEVAAGKHRWDTVLGESKARP